MATDPNQNEYGADSIKVLKGLDAVRTALSSYPMTYQFMLNAYEQVKAGQGRLIDIIVGFIDPNAPDEIAAPVNPKLAAAAAPGLVTLIA